MSKVQAGGLTAHQSIDMTSNNFSFQKGWSQVKNGDLAECRNKLMAAFNITTRAAWGKRLKGEVEPKISEVHAVESIFAEYGIRKVWGTV